MRRKIQKPLALLLAFAMMFCMVPAAGFAADNGDSEAAVERIAGQDRWETAALTAVEKYGTNDTVIIARGDDDGNFADGLAASYLAKVKDAPILLTNPNSLPDATEKAIKDLNAQNAIVLGGELAVSEAVVNELEGLELEVERIEGGDRFGTAAAIAKAGGNADTALVVSGYAPADSLVAGPVAFNNDYPVLLVQKDSVPPATEDAIEELGIDNILVVGGETVISDAVYNALDADDRYAGYTRIDTSVVVADELFEEPETFTIVGRQDKNLADAVGAAVLGNPILYVGNDISDIEEYLNEVITADTQFVILGGTNAVNEAVENALNELAPEEEGLVVESVSAINAKKLEVKFSQPVDETEAETATNYEVINKNDGTLVTVSAAALSADEKVVTLTLGTALDGSYVVTVKPIESKDDSNVKTPVYVKEISFSDKVKPTLVGVNYPAAGVAVLQMSEELGALGTATVTRVDGQATTATATLDTNDASKIIVKPIEPNVEYKVIILGAKDMAGNLISPNPTEITVKSTVVDTEKPTVKSIVSDGLDTIIVTFSEEVDPATIALKIDGADVIRSSATQNPDNKLEVIITLTTAVQPGAHSVTISDFKDLAIPPNTGDPVTKNLQFTEKPPKLVKTTVEPDASKVTFTFDMDITLASEIVPDLDLTRVDPDMVTTTVTVKGGDISATGKDLVLTPTTENSGMKGFGPGKYTGKLTKDLITNLGADEEIAISFEVKDPVDTEKATPSVTSIDAKNVVVTYDKDMSPSAIDVNNYKVEGKSVFSGAIFDGDAKTVKLTFIPGSIKYDGDYEFTISSNVKTKAGVPIEPFKEVCEFKENVAPTVKKVEFIAPKTIKVTFSEVIDSYTADPFEVYVDGEKVEIGTINAVTTGGTTDYIEITMNNELDDLTKDIIVKFAKGAEVKDANGNELVPEASYIAEK